MRGTRVRASSASRPAESGLFEGAEGREDQRCAAGGPGAAIRSSGTDPAKGAALMQSTSFVLLFALGTLLASTGCSVCGDTTAQSSAILGTVTYDGIASSRTSESISAFDSDVSVSWHDDHGNRTVHIDFDDSAPLTTGEFALEAQGATACTSDSMANVICSPVTGTLSVTLFVLDHCGTGSRIDDIGCPTHFEADLQLSADVGVRMETKVHLHEDGKLVPYHGCVGDRFGK
jgi:hypothetical protein